MILILVLLGCLSSPAHSDGLQELEELLEVEYHNFTQLCNSTSNSTVNEGFLGGFSKWTPSLCQSLTRSLQPPV